MIKPLGILYYNDKVVNHRSILKILLNPLLRCFGFTIYTVFHNNNFYYYTFRFNKKNFSLNIFKSYYSSLFTCNKYNFILLEKRLF